MSILARFIDPIWHFVFGDCCDVDPDADPDQPMTADQYQRYYNRMIVGQAFGNTISGCHQHFVEKRRHEEMMKELRRIF
jgi:hypothetical protein